MFSSLCFKSLALWGVATTRRTFERLIDANLNRFKEGVRVVEDVFRYLYDQPSLALQLKHLRHSATDIVAQHLALHTLYAHRDSVCDVLQDSDTLAKEGDPILSMLQANFKRAQESARVLEECFKYAYPLQPPPTFKTLRYQLYVLEKECIDFFTQKS
ncbi:thiamine-phosphate pyrophosphorylase [Helicobacter felis]|uniref:thiamine-phosphate pyrophosphorylase n=1 Tax=Helicobacter felis TaxID=214 RepID=UPI000CF1852A|nr:thiamine-phosphate pyrophosphorylase [Helicobacter felis]